MLKIPVRAEHHQVVSDAKLREERIDRSDLESAAAAFIAKVRGGDVVLALRHDERQRGEPLEDLCSRLRAAESLEKFLEDQAGRENRSLALKCVGQEVNARIAVLPIAAQRKRPDTRVNEDFQRRDRAAL
ncbi:MAG TPA: hypothetical protein VGJ81_15940 [Thermoanaerobaculia bacterium]|jgi:hypothetical protein